MEHDTKTRFAEKHQELQQELDKLKSQEVNIVISRNTFIFLLCIFRKNYLKKCKAL